MKIQSMTGFGKGEAGDSDYTVLVEIKSVNNRFKDLRFKLPSLFSSLEMELRSKLSAKFKRGNFDIAVLYRRVEGKTSLDELDERKILSYVGKIKGLLSHEGLAVDVRPCDFLRSEFYKDHDEDKEKRMHALLLKSFEEALSHLEDSRKMEGKKLAQIVLEHKKNFEENYFKICELVKTHQETIKEKLKKSFAEHQADFKIDEGRFNQELIYYLEKVDIHEEIDRIKTHLAKFEKLLSTKNEVGKELDFLLQELNRETNTIGSKTIVDEISGSVVQMKVHLEKIREQSLNIE